MKVFGHPVLVPMLALSALALAACSSGAAAAGAGSTSSSTTTAPSTSSAAPVAQAETTPTAGLCWHATGEQVGDQASWDGTPPKPCGGPHNAETTYVGTIPNSAATPYTAVPNDFMALVTSSCTDAQLTKTFGADVTALQDTWWATGEGGLPAAKTAVPLLITYSYFFPTAASWASGARWFRCDIGSPPSYDSPNWSDAPRAFKDVLRADPRFFAICSDKAFTAAPTVSDTPTSSFDSYKPCNAASPWKLTAVVVLAKDSAERFPGSGQVLARATAGCPAGGTRRHVEVPSKAAWDGSHLTGASCWAYEPSR